MANANSSIDVSSEALAEEAFRRVQAEMAALDEADILQINLDVSSALATAYGALPKLKGYREAFGQVGGGFDLERFDKLEDYTLALSHTQSEYTTAAEPTDDIRVLYEEALALRETLRSDLSALAHRGLVAADRLDDLTGAIGHKNVAMDLQALASVLRNTWPTIEGKTPTQKSDIEHASRLATRIIRVVGEREQAPPGVAEAAALRARAFTLFMRAYDEARRALIFLRWHEGDADVIAPSLFSKRGRGKRKEEEETPVAATAPVVPTPGAALAPPGASTLPGGVTIPTGPPPVPGAIGATPGGNTSHGPFG